MKSLSKGAIVRDTYRIRHFIGEGAFGEAYQVEHKFLGVQVLKLFKKAIVESHDLRSVLSEAQILSGLTHDSIVRVFEANTFMVEDTERFYMTMEYVSGETLGQYLKREIILPVDQSLSIGLGFLKGLSVAHGRNPTILHRDISPDNILLEYGDESSNVKLGDFGLATSMDKLSNIPCAGGKYFYMAPECFWDAYFTASDIFSAGVVIYKMLTGCFPWTYELDDIASKREISPRISVARREQAQPPSAFCNDVSPKLDAIILKSIELDVENRFGNVDELMHELQSIEGKVKNV